jgi:hypothetical protein
MRPTSRMRSSVEVGASRKIRSRPAALSCGGEGLAFLGRVVDDQHAVDAGRPRIGHEAVAMALVVALDRVGVAHQHHRRAASRWRNCAPRQHLGQADAARQGAFAGLLDHRAVGHRVAEGHAELDDVGAAFDQRMHDLGRGVGKRVAGGHVGDQRLAALGLQRGQAWLRCGSSLHLPAPPFTSARGTKAGRRTRRPTGRPRCRCPCRRGPTG